jgi:phthalate 4,5-dioxygenase oxygenase subunit
MTGYERYEETNMPEKKQEDLNRVGPKSPMGKLMRQYWIPALLSSEIEPDGPPLRVKLLGEELIAFRTASGRIGLMDHRCPHRCASLFFGRNEEEGIRCVYHGWKYDPDGQCVDQPSEPPEYVFKPKVQATAYATCERAGLVWAFMGPKGESLPELPDIEATGLPEDEIQVWAALRECNWLQGLEGDIDTSHFGFLHIGSATEDQAAPGSSTLYAIKDRAPRYKVEDTPFGTTYGAYRPGDEGMNYWRIAHFLFPFWTMPPGSPMERQMIARAWVPMDDEHTMFYHISRAGSGPSRNRIAGRQIAGLGAEIERLPNTNDWYGRWRLACNRDNDYMMDRHVQSTESYTGILGGHVQDQMITESMGPVTDWTRERLGSSDQMIIQTRRRILRALDEFRTDGTVPPGAADPKVYDRVRSGTLMLPLDADWVREIENIRRKLQTERQ